MERLVPAHGICAAEGDIPEWPRFALTPVAKMVHKLVGETWPSSRRLEAAA